MRNGMFGLISAVALASGIAVAGCGSSTTSGGTGGSANTGGNAGTGGSPNTGGSTATGGNVATGGAAKTGGNSGSGGQSAGGASGTSGVTSLEGTKAVGSLSKDEATKLCDDTYAYFDSAITKATKCKWKALSYATSSSAPTEEKLKSNCSTKEASCLSETASTGNPGCGEIPSTCKATVAEYAACIADEVKTYNQAVAGLPNCADFTNAGTDAIWTITGADLPASCNSLNAKCPTMYPPDPR